ncbi:alpha/beta hydrolase [Ahrensia sp. 13_GOM-1096m]|uniref:alpha/beta hydrolase n=1 Tax=Ahrensia sp. 13_GOM-1096m TaxID=1380380 RepID=UPI001FFE54FE|nr:alpha/beta hydrolase [Ahrensia sp. 13_GOM-1096m]
MAHIEGSEKLPDLWADNAASYRASSVRIDIDIAYGTHPRAKFDLVWPDETPKGLAIFIHGGFWMRLNKSHWTHYAEGARANGWAVCLPSYTLAPEARVNHMTRQIGAAIEAAASRITGPICLSGHSAGGHLATRMICDDTPLAKSTLERVAKTLSISGLHDLRPLLHTKMNDVLHLDETEAFHESPALHRPATPMPLTCWVGGGERPEFIRQSEIITQIWGGLGTQTSCVVDTQHNHFTVIEALKQHDSPITETFLV